MVKFHAEAGIINFDHDEHGTPREQWEAMWSWLPVVAFIFCSVVVVQISVMLIMIHICRPKTSELAHLKTMVVLGSDAFLFPRHLCHTHAGGHTAEMMKLVESLDRTKYHPRAYVVANTDALSGRKAEEFERGCTLAPHPLRLDTAGSVDLGEIKGGGGPASATRLRTRQQKEGSVPPPSSPLPPPSHMGGLIDNGHQQPPSAPPSSDSPPNAPSWEVVRISRSREVGQSYLTSVWTTLVACISAVFLVWEVAPQVVLVNGPGTCIPICFAAALYRLLSGLPVKIIHVESIARTRKLSLTGKILYHLRMTDLLLVQWEGLLKTYPRARYAGRLY